MYAQTWLSLWGPTTSSLSLAKRKMLLTKWQTTLEGVAIEFERSLRGTHHVHVQLKYLPDYKKSKCQPSCVLRRFAG